MRTNQYHAEYLKGLFRKRRVATMPELKGTLGTKVTTTVFRKLRELAALTSYSHRGKYYTLPSIARFNRRGLWFFRSARFSQHGTLKNTLRDWVTESRAGYFEQELEELLHVVVRVPLLTLLEEGALAREKLEGRYLYLSPDPAVGKRQKEAREKEEVFGQPSEPSVLHHELRAALILFMGVLNEKQRRLYAGLESLRRGRGGDGSVAELLEVDEKTIARGRKELLAGDVNMAHIRNPGGGRRPVEKKDRISPKPSPN